MPLFQKDASVTDNDGGVSPVIAVVVLVAMVVLLTGGLQLWLSGFGASDDVKKFPQLLLRDDADSATTGVSPTAFEDDDAIAHLAHRGGDAIDWHEYMLNVLDGTGTTKPVNFDSAQDCADTATQMDRPTGPFAVGGMLYICAFDGSWQKDDEIRIQIIELNHNTIVFDAAVIVS